MIRLRPFGGPRDLLEMQQLASRAWPRGLHPGGLAWSAAIGQLATQLVVAEESGLVGWGGLNHPDPSMVQADPSSPGAAPVLLAWLLEVSRGAGVSLEVGDDDIQLQAAATAAGLSPVGDGGAILSLRRSVSGAVPALPPGYSIRSVEPGEEEQRVEAHRAAWLPAELPWAPEYRPAVDPEARSRFLPEHYHEVQRLWLYQRDLDLVVIAPDGSMAACCIGWFDQGSGWAEIEPLGVVPAHRRRGLAGALCLEVGARVAKAGGRELFINTGPRPDYPAPVGAYAKVGFKVFRRGCLYRSQT